MAEVEAEKEEKVKKLQRFLQKSRLTTGKQRAAMNRITLNPSMLSFNSQDSSTFLGSGAFAVVVRGLVVRWWNGGGGWGGCRRLRGDQLFSQLTMPSHVVVVAERTADLRWLARS